MKILLAMATPCRDMAVFILKRKKKGCAVYLESKSDSLYFSLSHSYPSVGRFPQGHVRMFRYFYQKFLVLISSPPYYSGLEHSKMLSTLCTQGQVLSLLSMAPHHCHASLFVFISFNGSHITLHANTTELFNIGT